MFNAMVTNHRPNTLDLRRVHLGAMGSFLSLAPALLGVAAANCPPQYELTPLPFPACPGGNNTAGIASSIGAQSDVVGSYVTCSGGSKAFVWTADLRFTTIVTATNLPNAFGTDINGNGHAVGAMNSDTNGTYHPFIAVDGFATDVGAPPGFPGAFIRTINELDEMAGYAQSSSQRLAAVWDARGPRVLELPLGPSAEAFDINDRGQVCGWMGVFPIPPYSSSGFVYDSGVVHTIESPIAGATVEAREINDAGMVLGQLTVPNGQPFGGDIVSFTWQRGTLSIIDPPAGMTGCIATSINNEGAIVGVLVGDALYPFILKNGVFTLLKDVLEQGNRYTIHWARSINDAGQILVDIVDGPASCPALLTPILPVAGDLDCDRRVGAADLAILLGQWGSDGSADLDGDGIVGAADLGLLLGSWTA